MPQLEAPLDVTIGPEDETLLAPPGGAPPALPFPARVGAFEILRELARGGMGVVYEARHTELGRRVALKVLLAGHHATPEERRRFAVEARAAARLEHPGIVGIHEVGEDQGRPYLAMDLVPGRTLAERLAAGPLEPTEAVCIAEALARALHFAHRQQVLHRDVKPANVLLTDAGRPVLTDFGLAREVDASARITASGQLLGTPAYMPPEQAEGRVAAIDPRTDVYALGATLYEMLTGRPPFRGGHPVQVIAEVLQRDPAPPARLRPGLDPDLGVVCLKCLEKDPARRYPSAEALAEDLARVRRHEPIHARAPSWLQRGRKWGRRNRLALRLLLGALALLVALSAASSGLEHWTRAQRQARFAAELEALRAEPPVRGSAEFERWAARLVRDPEPEHARLLVHELERLNARLCAATRALYLEAHLPDAGEAARGETPVEGLPGAVARLLALAPGASPAPADAERLARAEARLEGRAARRVPSAVRAASTRAVQLVANAQEQALGPDGVRMQLLLGETLARLGGALAGEALARTLFLEADQFRAAQVAAALARCDDPRFLRLVALRRARFGHGLYQERANELVGDLPGVGTPREDPYAAGCAAFAQGDFRSAVAALSSAIAADPRDARAWGQRALAHLELDAFRPAYADGSRALELDPDSVPGLVARGAGFIVQGRLDEAVADLDRAVELDPRRAFAWFLRGEAHSQARRPRRALADFERGLQLDPNNLRGVYSRGVVRYQLGDPRRALRDFDRALELDGSFLGALLNRGSIRAMQGDLDGAFADLSRVLELAPEFEPAWANRGNVRRLSGDLDGAVADLEHAVHLQPQDAIAWSNLGMARTARGEPDRALGDLDRALDLKPDFYEALLNRGTTRRVLEDLEGSIADLTSAIVLDPDRPEGWFNRGNSHRIHGKPAQARADYDKALQVAPTLALAWVGRAELLLELGELEAAAADVERGIELDPGAGDAWTTRAAIRERQDQLAAAKADLDRALELEPRDPAAWTLRGFVRKRLRDLPGAIADYGRALELDPQRAIAYSGRGFSHKLAGRREEAIADLTRFLELAPDHRDAPGARRALEALGTP